MEKSFHPLSAEPTAGEQETIGPTARARALSARHSKYGARPISLAFAGLFALTLAACGGGEETPSGESAMPLTSAEKLDAVLSGAQRSQDERARDQFRNPAETLLFFGVEPEMTVVEIWPGGGWYTNIIAPYLAGGGGAYIAAHVNPERSERAAAAVQAFKDQYQNKPNLYGSVSVTALPAEDPIAPDASADAVLTFRNVHNWMSAEFAEDAFTSFFQALKPGGLLGVVEHRADGSTAPLSSGYVSEKTVIDLAVGAGFVLDARSEINANTADTKDHPYGVWTLPPVRRSSAQRGVVDPEFDREKYDAIGESDRMTLRFIKPAPDPDTDPDTGQDTGANTAPTEPASSQ
ncbi:MAG: methyltransferase domain-containing protein [Pseudomonadota bacterium]